MSRNAPTIPTDASTSAFTTVSSSAGFSAGDLVYQKSNNVGLVASNAVATATFNIDGTGIATAGLYPNTARSLGLSVGSGGGSYMTPNAAKLTNGNMVVVWVSGTGDFAFFRIVNEAGTEVVAATSLGSAQSSAQMIAVAALTGGGFAAVWANTSNQFAYAIFNNAGTVVTAQTNESSIGVSSSSLTVAPRPDGSFIAVVNDTTANQARFKVYSATGVQVIAWTNVAVPNNARARSAVAVRSDNSFVIGVYTSSTNIQYYIYSSTGVAGSNATLISSYSGTASNGHLDMTTLTNDGVVFVYYSSTNTYIIYKILSAANSLGSDNIVSGTQANVCAVKSLSGGGFVIAWDVNTTRQLRFAFYNAAGSSLSGVRENYGGASNSTSANGLFYPTIVEMASNVAFINVVGKTSTSMTQANISTYAIRNFTTVTQLVGSASSPVSGYARGASTPNAAAFLASTNATLSVTTTQASGSSNYILAPTAIQTANTANGLCARVMPNSDIVIGVGHNGIGGVLYVYNSLGTVLKNTISITSYTNAYLRMCVLTNGNLVVVYNTSSSSASAQIFNSSYTLLSTTVLSLPNAGSLTAAYSYGFDVSPMINNRFVVGFYDNSSLGASARVFNSDATVYSSAYSAASTTSAVGCTVAGTSSGGFVIKWHVSSGVDVNVSWYANTSGSTYANMTTQTFNAGSAPQAPYFSGITVSPNDTVLTAFVDSGANSYPLAIDANGTSTQLSAMNSGFSSGNLGIFGVSTMPDGRLVAVKMDSGGGGVGAYAYAVVSPSAGSSLSNIAISSFTFASNTPQTYNNNSGPMPSVCATLDNQIVVAYVNNSNYACFMIFDTIGSSTYSTTLVSGTTTSLPAYYPSQSNGYILKGVATTAATAGGTGIVQTNGSTQLNSQYPSGTTAQAFDSTGTVIQGTKGTIVGRNVTMTGGV
jgi:hypothetical protein